MSKQQIVRRPDFAGGGLTEEECRRMAEHVALWTRRAFRTEPIDRDEITRAIIDLYAAAGLKAPHVVIVPSPLVMAVAGSFAAAIWYARKHGRALASRASRDATDDATHAEGRAPGWARALAHEIAPDLADFMLACVPLWYRPYQGGNMWAAWECYLTSARDILGLRLPAHEKYDAWERAAIHGGYRYMHEEFCMVSDFPEVLEVDAQNRPHCDSGPSHRWRDGWSL